MSQLSPAPGPDEPRESPPPVGPDRYCIRCGYLLHGLSPLGRCPECGTDIALSLREPTLASSAPEYLASLGRGLSLVLYGILLMIIVTIGAGVFAVSTGGGGVYALVIESISLAVQGMMLWGYWLFTQPDPSQVAAESMNASRRIVRASVIALAATSVFELALAIVMPPPHTTAGAPTGASLVAAIAHLAGFLAWAVLLFASMRYTRWIGGRVPDRFIVRRTGTYMWLLPILVVPGCVVLYLGPLVAMVLYWNLLDRLRRHVRSIIATGAPAALPKMNT